MQSPLVSVVVTAFNSEAHIFDALDSVLNQTYPHIEIIVVDDCSTDNTISLISSLAGRIRQRFPLKVIENKPNAGGPALPRNLGMAKASGKFIAFLDADDVWAPSKISIQVDLLMRFAPEGGLCVTRHQKIRNPEAFIAFLQEEKPVKVSKSNLRVLWLKNLICLSSAMVSANLVNNCRFDPDPGLHGVEDYYFWLSLHCNGLSRVIRVDKQLVGYRISNQNSLSGDKKRQNIRSIYSLCRIYLVDRTGRIKLRTVVFGIILRLLRMCVA